MSELLTGTDEIRYPSGYEITSTMPLIEQWASIVSEMERRGQTGSAQLMQSMIDDFKQYLVLYFRTPLTVERAAYESGYSSSSIRRMVTEGVLRNVGSNGEVRIRRFQLPGKPNTSMRRMERAAGREAVAKIRYGSDGG